MSQDTIPHDLKTRNQWVVWCAEPDAKKPGKTNKTPYDAKTGKHASSTDSATWTDYQTACNAVTTRKMTGIGYVFTEDDPYVGIDLDDCIFDGQMQQWASVVVADLGSYTEISPSGCGVKIWVTGDKPPTGINLKGAKVPQIIKAPDLPGGIEIYGKGRFFTVTGQHYPGTPTSIEYANGTLESLIGVCKPPEILRKPTTPTICSANQHAAAWAEKRMQDAESMLHGAVSGEYHATRLAAGRLAGGIVAHGLISADEAIQRLYAARVPQSHQTKEWKAIQDGVLNGMSEPLELPAFPTDQDIVLSNGIGYCPACDTKIQRSKYPYPETTENGWYCPECKHPMVWPVEAYTPVQKPQDAPKQSVHKPGFAILWNDDIDAIPDPTFLIHGAIVHNEVTVIAGLGDTGKTSIVADIAFRVAQYYPVVYIAAEDAPGIKLRRQAWTRHYKTPIQQFGILARGEGVPCAVQLMNTTQVDSLIAVLQPAQPKLVVIDTLSQCATGADENGNDMTFLASSCTRIAHDVGCAVVILHHTTKDGKHYRGHSSLKDNTYGFFEVTRDDDVITMSKIRVKNTGGEFIKRFSLLVIDLGTDDKGHTITSTVPLPTNKVIRSDALQPTERKVLDLIRTIQDSGESAATARFVCAAAKECSISEKTIYNKLRELRRKEYLNKDTLEVTAKGRKALDDETQVSATQERATVGGWEINTDLLQMGDCSGFSTHAVPEATYTPATANNCTPDIPRHNGKCTVTATTANPLQCSDCSGDNLLNCTTASLKDAVVAVNVCSGDKKDSAVRGSPPAQPAQAAPAAPAPPPKQYDPYRCIPRQGASLPYVTLKPRGEEQAQLDADLARIAAEQADMDADE